VKRSLNSQDTLVKGIVVKAYSGFYYAHDGRREWECKLRGRFRYTNQQVMVGDHVEFMPGQDGYGVIEKLLPRRTLLVRPPVANVDQAVIVFAVREPDPNPGLLGRFLVAALSSRIEPIICFNKVDLTKDGQVELVSQYRENYRVVITSAKTGKGLDNLRDSLKEKISVLAGPSGVGKTTLLNALLPGLKLKTGEVSSKLKQGRHTTRHVELIYLPEGGLVADTPGFTSLELPEIKPEELASLFPDIKACLTGCYFKGCLHFKEPKCAVKEAVESGKIQEIRYNQYLEYLAELMDRRRY